MTNLNTNVMLLNTLKQYAPVANKAKIQNIIDLYKSRSIKNIKTALQNVNLLSSSNKSQKKNKYIYMVKLLVNL